MKIMQFILPDKSSDGDVIYQKECFGFIFFDEFLFAENSSLPIKCS